MPVNIRTCQTKDVNILIYNSRRVGLNLFGTLLRVSQLSVDFLVQF
jgi:hypothetical protein